MFGAIGRGWKLAKASWAVLKSDRSLAIFPILSAICVMAATVLVLSPGWLAIDWSAAASSATTTATGETANNGIPEMTFVVLGLISCFIATFLTIFFNVALASCATRAMDGEDTKVSEGLTRARQLLPVILGWAVVAFIAGLILRVLDGMADRAPFPLNIVANIGVWLLGMAWALVTYLVIPVIALEELGPKQALTRSKDLITKTWGEGLVGNVSITLAVGLIGFLPAFFLILGGAMAWSSAAALGAALVVLGIALMIASAIVGSTLSQIFGVALYRYAAGVATPGFDTADLQTAMIPKPKRKGAFGR
jgi:hypothetical protein